MIDLLQQKLLEQGIITNASSDGSNWIVELKDKEHGTTLGICIQDSLEGALGTLLARFASDVKRNKTYNGLSRL